MSAAAWVAPAIITMDPAGAADLTSPPPKPPNPPPPEVLGEVHGAATDPEVSGASDDGGHLPFTGANLEQLTIAGLAATAAGGAMHFWSARTGTAAANPAETPPA